MAHDDALHDGQADAGAGVFVFAVQALEGAKEPVRRGHVEAASVVAHKENGFAVEGLAADVDVGDLFAGRKLPGVSQQVVEQAAHQGRVGHGFQVRGDPHLRHPFGGGLHELGGDLAGDFTDIDHAQLHRQLVQARHVQERVDQRAHALARGHDPVDQIDAVGTQFAGVFPDQFLAEPDDDPDRGAQVVSNRIAEGFELFEALFELRGALGHQALQAVVEQLQPEFAVLAFRDVLHHARHALAGGVARVELDPARRDIFGQDTKLFAEPFQFGQALVQPGGHLGPFLGVHAREQVVPVVWLVQWPAQQFGRSGRCGDGRGGRVHFQHAHARSLQGLLQQPLVVHEFNFQLVTLEGHLDRGVQLALRKGLEQVAIGAGLPCALQRGVFGVRGEVDHRRGVGFTQPGGHLDAVHVALDVDVHQHQIGLGLREHLHALFTRDRNGGHVVAQLRQTLLQVEGNDALVFHHQDAGGSVHVFRSSGKRKVKQVGPLRCTSSRPWSWRVSNWTSCRPSEPLRSRF
ncbi:hypothetical protein Y695_02289 [Hydrogenophaga sp. T4]|nr:hypothetical protein Y695_02289 [Hydrogenophaga sp. T4]